MVSKNSQLSTCDVHRGKEIEVFCNDCRKAILYDVLHKLTQTAHIDIAEVSGDLRKQVNNDIDKVSELLKKTGEALHLEKQKNDLVSRFTGIIEDNINIAAAYKSISAIILLTVLREVESNKKSNNW